MIKVKEFVLKTNYYNNETITDIINTFISNGNIDIVDIKYSSNILQGSSEMYVRALLIYKEKGE